MLNPEMLQRMGAAMAAAAELAVTVTLGVFLGAWLDTRFGTAPTFLLFTALAGLVAGFVRLTRRLQSTESRMTTTPTTIAASATVIGAALVGGALVQGDVALAWALAVSAAVMLVNFGLWVLAVQRLFNAVLSGGSGNGATALIATKMVAIGFSTWGLVVLFPASAVLLGGSVVVFSILLHAAVLGATELASPREA